MDEKILHRIIDFRRELHTFPEKSFQ